MRMARVFLPQSRVFNALISLALDATFSLGETESSRSRNTRSGLLAAAFSIMRSLLAGVDNSERLRRILASQAHLRGRPQGIAPTMDVLACSRHSSFPSALLRADLKFFVAT